MGCTQSKIENEEIVNRCKERKKVMKESVSSRNAFAAAHFSYAAALKNTGAALSDYAQGEVEFSDHHHHHHASAADIVSSSSSILPPAPPQPPFENLRPPPPPPLQRASTMPEFVVETEFVKAHPNPIMEDIDEDDEIDERSLKHRSSRSSGGGGTGIGGGGSRSGSKREIEKEDLPPPPRQNEKPLNRAAPPPPAPPGMTSWDYFFPEMENMPGSSLSEVHHDNNRNNRFERKVIDEEIPKSDYDDDEDGGGDTEVEEVVEEVVVEEPPPPPPKVVKKVKVPVPVPVPTEARKSSGMGGGQSLNLVQIFTELDDCFLKASESANEVSKMLEANRLHYHSNFADNRGILISC